jgi:hypothetical protein
MSRFTTRVELYGNPTFETYKSLHDAMERNKFSRKVQYNSKTFWLPNAEYTWEGAETTVWVKDLTVKIAATVWKDFGVMVTRTEVTREFHNLKSV